MHSIAQRAIDGESILTLVEEFYGPRGPLAEAGWDLRESQREMSMRFAAQIDESEEEDGSIGLIEAPTGCHAKGQGILMFDGTIKAVEDVVVGDRLMGPDSKARNVLALARGEQEMYDIVPIKGRPWRVNRDHILTLVRCGHRKPHGRRDQRQGEIVDVRLSDYLGWSKSQKYLYKLFRAPVAAFHGEASSEDLLIPPWVLGAMLGDGGFKRHNRRTSFTSVDPEVFLEIKSYVESIGCRFETLDDRHHVIIGLVGYRKHPLRNKLRALGLFGAHSGTKFIPHVYKTASRQARLELLAGLIDTDGSSIGHDSIGFDYISKSEALSNDVAFVARSLGLAAYVKPCEKKSQTGFEGDYFRVSISGHCDEVPVRLDRKRAPKRTIKKDCLRTGFSLNPVGVEPYYGFSLDGDGRFLLDDFTVTHNTGKGQAYLVPGFLAALRAEAKFVGREATAKTHPAKLVVSTANIALQGQLIRKDIPALGRMLGVQPRATLMKSRQNYVCREELLEAAGSMYGRQDQSIQDVYRWTQQPGCDGDRESYPGDATEVWHKVSRGSEDCGRQSCPHYDVTGGAAPCFWRAATVDWPRSHIIVGNHHWVALTKGIKVIAYAVDEAHELEAALRGVQGRTLSTSKFVSVAKRCAKVIGTDPEPVERRMTEVAQLLFDGLERFIESKIPDCSETSMDYKTPVPLRPGWAGEEFTRRLGNAFSYVRDLRDKVVSAAIRLPFNTLYEGEVQTRTIEKTEEAKTSRQAGTVANRMIDLCEIMAAVCCGRPHPDWPSNTSPWAIWAHREKDPRDQWRVLVELVPADVAPAFAGLQARFPTMLLASATLPEFSSMRLSLGMGARWVGQPVDPWPGPFRTDTGLFAGRCEVVTPADDDPEQDDEPTSNRLATPSTLAPTPKYERRLPSPYPLESMGVLFVPHGPAPGDAAAWQSWATQKVVAAVRQSGGGALILATSNAAMRRYTEALRAENCWTVIKQGDSGRGKVIQAFKDEEDSVLVGTRSLFQGLDVQGRSCRLVIIDRIPFGNPKDPLEEAVGQLLVERALALNPKARGATPWMIRTAPEAAMVLVQGVGRLIRSLSDRGAVVLLDNRILQPGSGFALLRDALPPFPLSNRLEDISRILSGSPLSGAIQRRSTFVQADLAF